MRSIKLKGLRWYIAGLLCLASALNYLDRQTLSVLIGTIKEELHLTNASYGEINAWFLASYALIDLNSNGIVELPDPRDDSRIIKVRRKQYITGELQKALVAAKSGLVDRRSLFLGKDEDMRQQLMDTREQKMPSGYITYISGGKHNEPLDHITDALRCITAASAWAEENEITEETGAGLTAGLWSKNIFHKDSWKPMWERS